MRRILYPFLFLVLLSSCGNEEEAGQDTRKAKGPVHYGGVFTMNELEDFRSLNPLDVNTTVSHHITNLVYEGLYKLDPKDLTPVKCLAEDVQVSDSARKYTFKIRKGVMFHDDECFPNKKGREVTAEDFKYSFDRLCGSQNTQFAVTFKDRVVGANAYFDAVVNQKKSVPGGVSGVKVLDKNTLEISLINPYPQFLALLSMPGTWVYPKEAVEKYKDDFRTHCVGTGPFYLKTLKQRDYAILEYNPVYWEMDQYGNRLPYLKIVRFKFAKDKDQELIDFQSKELSIMYRIPVSMIPKIMGELKNAKKGGLNFTIEEATAMSIFYFGFNTQMKPFDNVNLRRAFNHAIDRKTIVDEILEGEGVPAENGFVPPVFPNYGTDVKGFTYDVEKAKSLLAEAGYPGGRGLGKVTIYTNSGGGDRNIKVSEAIKNMLKQIGVEANIETLQLGQHLKMVEGGESGFWRFTWIADFPDPENFLSLFYGKNVPSDPKEISYVNPQRFKNSKYDSIFEAAQSEGDIVKRYQLYKAADQVIVDQAPIVPVFYDENQTLVQKNIKGYVGNAMDYRDLTRVYVEPEKKK